MIRSFTVENFKSIDKLTMELGRFNVLIGENGSGKSNVVEALVVACAGYPDATFLGLRGVRVPSPSMMLNQLSVRSGNGASKVVVTSDRGAWRDDVEWDDLGGRGYRADEFERRLSALEKGVAEQSLAPEEAASEMRRLVQRLQGVLGRGDFCIYAPENSTLRTYSDEQQLRPVGIRGEGLFAHLLELTKIEEGSKVVEEILASLRVFDWFESAELPKDLSPGEQRISIFDRYLAKGALLDQRSANEGFLFALFYFTLLASPVAPNAFAIDNVDTSFNPRLCVRIVKELIDLAKKHEKQVVVTTHNPSVLDALDLSDDEQRLFVISRTSDGATRARRIPQPKPVGDQPVVPLSEAFLRGYLGGLPTNF